MRKIAVLLFCLMLFTGYSQDIKVFDKYSYLVEYDFTFQMDSTDVSSIKHETMLLEIGNRYSKFNSIGFHLRDSIERNTSKDILYSQNTRLFRNIPQTKFNSVVIKNRSEQEISVYQKVITDFYVYDENLNCYNWQIEEETKTIAGYLCQKATAHYMGRDYVAWFTNEIPISDGPYKFNGLPGLIVNIHDTRNHYSYELLSLKKLKTERDIAIANEDYIRSSMSDVKRVQRDYYNNFFQTIEARGGGIEFNDPSDKKMVEANLKKMNNNSIELMKH